MSRADDPALPGVGAAVRASLFDFYYHSIRFVPANVAWGVGLLGVLAVTWFVAPPAGPLLVPLLAIPLTGVARLAALAARGHDVVLADAWGAWRRYGRDALLAGAVLTLAFVVLLTNVVVGGLTGGPAGWALATLAAWGLVAVWSIAIPFWVLLVDPARDGWPLVARARLAGLLLVAEPGRMLRLALAEALILGLSTVLFAALLTIGVAYALLVAARATLPAADRLAARMAGRFPAPVGPRDGGAVTEPIAH